MTEDDGAVCCILGVCCAAASAARVQALAADLAAGTGCSPEAAARAAAHLLDRYDLAPKGLLAPFIAAIAGHAQRAERRRAAR